MLLLILKRIGTFPHIFYFNRRVDRETATRGITPFLAEDEDQEALAGKGGESASSGRLMRGVAGGGIGRGEG